MPLWVEKYRPKTIQELDVNPEQRHMLKVMLKNSKCHIPHLLVYGPSGSGKKTRVNAILRSIYGSVVDKVKFEKQKVEINSKKLEIDVTSSNYHLECTPADAGNQDRHVIQELITKLASHRSVSSQNYGTVQSKKNQITFKVIIIHEADRLSKDAQHALRRTMEQYMSKCRCILMAKGTSRIIDPLISRCLPIKCRAATEKELREVVYLPIKKKWHNYQPDEKTLDSIIQHSNRDMRKFILMLEVNKVAADATQGRAQNISQVKKSLPDWEIFLEQLATKIKGVNDVSDIPAIRSALYELLSHLIPSHLILNHLMRHLIKGEPSVLRQAIIDQAAKSEYRVNKGSQNIYHLENFVVQYLGIREDFKQTGEICVAEPE